MKILSGKAVYAAAAVAIFAVALAVMLVAGGGINVQDLPLIRDGRQAEAETEIPTIATMRHFSSEELSALLKEAERRNEALEAEARRLAQTEGRLAIYKQEIEREKQELLKLRGEIEQTQGELSKAQRELAQKVSIVEQSEIEALRRSASIYESMEPARAAAALALLETAQAARLLSFIDEKRAARLVQEMAPEKAAELMKAVGRVVTAAGGEQ